MRNISVEHRASLARQFDCDPSEVEARLDAREEMFRKIAERAEHDDPYGYQRGRDTARARQGRMY